MPVKFDVKADFREVERYMKNLGPAANRAATRALNRTITATKAEAAREIQKKRNLKIAVIKQKLHVLKANRNRLSALITASGKSIPIRHFDARQSRRGVSVKIRKAGKRTVLKKYGNKSFIVPKLGGNVFVRHPTQKMRKKPTRAAIIKFPPAPGIASVFRQRQVEAAMQKTARTTWTKRFQHEIEFELKKAAAKARG